MSLPLGLPCRASHPPLRRHPASRPLPARSENLPFGRLEPPSRSCSDLVVSHHLVGLLRVTVSSVLQPEPTMGFVAFLPGAQARSLLLPRRPGFPATQLPLDEFPSLTAVPHHCGRCPPVVTAHSCRRPREVGAFEPAGA